MLAEIRGSCKQNREFANIAQKCFQNLANKKSVWSLCKVVQTKKTSHKVGVLTKYRNSDRRYDIMKEKA